ncbi:DUF6898 family protein [Caenispirillum bisanense]|uniref:DUF6898 domain-containing protein n=1 Tax=Caenispirillum bisanense TaxID=414052 RepID=A0A286GGV4_9PROT|nr:hypothetical protein [Caenispirillum bisanense]SOD94234.1 hypothetical protein SAMN05421508_103422 [Caenispirillum bisanense]
MAARQPGDVLFEITYQGNVARCSAIDVATNTEVSIVAPATYSRFTLQQNALRKLNRALEAKGQGGR